VGRRVAYHLYREHPGGMRGYTMGSSRVDARHVIHLFDVNRAGAARGVSWFAPVITHLHDLHKYQDGQIKRQEVASLFAGVLSTDEDAESLEGELGEVQAGAILTIGANEQMTFSDPPAVDGYEAFMRATDRTIAAAMGITYEAFSGDYSNVNYTSGRMGRMDVDPQIKDWQENLMIARCCAPIGAWIKEGVEDVSDIPGDLYEIGWTPPVRPVVDPTKDYKADETAMRSGRKSRRQVIREGGQDPDAVEAEIIEERKWEKANGVTFTSSASVSPNAGGSTSANAGEQEPNKKEDDEDNDEA